MRVEYYNTVTAQCEVDLHYCGYEDVVPDFSCGPNIRDCYLIHYILKGSGFYQTGGKSCTVKAGSIFCIFPGDIVYYDTDLADPWSFCWFSFNGTKAEEYVRQIGLSRAKPVLVVGESSSIPALMDILLEAYQTQPSVGVFQRQASLFQLLAALEDSYGQSGKTPIVPRLSPSSVEKAIAFISYNYHKAVSIAELARHVGLERSYFSKLFNTTMGCPPQIFLQKYRIEKAQLLLKTTGLSIGEVCECVGFSDIFYFSRIFKKSVGLCPTKYRAAHIAKLV